VTDRLLPAGLVALLLVFLQWRSGADFAILTVVFTAAFAYVTVAGGRLLAAAAGSRDGDPSPRRPRRTVLAAQVANLPLPG